MPIATMVIDNKQPIYNLFPSDNSPLIFPPSPINSTSPPPVPYRPLPPRRSKDNKRRTSLDPLPPIEEPPHPPPPFEQNLPESPTLKPIHSLYNPQRDAIVNRPSSARGQGPGRHERRKSVNESSTSPPRVKQQPSDLEDLNYAVHQIDLTHEQGTTPPPPFDFQGHEQSHINGAESPSRSGSLKQDFRGRPPPPKSVPSDNSSRPSTTQEMRTHSPHINGLQRPPNPSPASTLSAGSLSKPPLLSPSSTLVPGKAPPEYMHATHLHSTPAHVQQYNATPYFHGGIGGRGNYRKVKREDKRAPLAYAPNVGAGPNAKFLGNIFARRGIKGASGGSDSDGEEGRTSEEESLRGGDVRNGGNMHGHAAYHAGTGGGPYGANRPEVALGAAEVMRRKLLRQAGVKTY